MKRPSFRAAIEWLHNNDDCEWLTDENGSPSVSACLVADLFGVHTDRVTADLLKLANASGQQRDPDRR